MNITTLEHAKYFVSKRATATHVCLWDGDAKDYIHRYFAKLGDSYVSIGRELSAFMHKEDAIDHAKRFKEICKEIIKNGLGEKDA